MELCYDINRQKTTLKYTQRGQNSQGPLKGYQRQIFWDRFMIWVWVLGVGKEIVSFMKYPIICRTTVWSTQCMWWWSRRWWCHLAGGSEVKTMSPLSHRIGGGFGQPPTAPSWTSSQTLLSSRGHLCVAMPLTDGFLRPAQTQHIMTHTVTKLNSTESHQCMWPVWSLVNFTSSGEWFSVLNTGCFVRFSRKTSETLRVFFRWVLQTFLDFSKKNWSLEEIVRIKGMNIELLPEIPWGKIP